MQARDVALIGTGYVGLVTGACLAAAGNRVVCHDIAVERIRELSAGRVPFHEPGLPEIVAAGAASGRLRFTTDLQDAVSTADVVFLAVSTPQSADGTADLSFVWDASASAAPHMKMGAVVVTRSTVPPGTGDELEKRLRALGRSDVMVASAPEFLAEGTAVKDFNAPERLVFGGSHEATARVAALFDAILPTAPRIHTDRRTAELSKYAANTFLAARVSLINEFANLCDALGGDVATLSQIVGLDSRIGPKFLRAGIGYGGSCFPKDVKAIVAVAKHSGVATAVAAATDLTNEAQWRVALARAHSLAGDLRGRTVAMWGIAFKPDTDDIRSAPSVRIIEALLEAGARVRAHDPKAKLPAALAARGVEQTPTAEAAARGADLVILATEWRDYRDLDWPKIASAMSAPRIVDGRNALPHAALRAAGFKVAAVGTGGGA